MKSIMIRLGLMALMISALAGCGDGKTGAAGAAGTPGTPGTGNVTTATNMTADQWKAANLSISDISVTINSAPVVTFRVTDDKGNRVSGLGTKGATSTSTNTFKLNNMFFTLAKLVPGANNEPSVWRSYLVTKPSAATATGAVTIDGKSMTGGFPQQELEGDLVDNGDGTYKYTFYRDITKAADYVTGMGAKAGLNDPADLGDVSYNPALTHRLGIVIKGNQPLSNPAVAIALPANATFDFVPATPGVAPTVTRNIVQRSSCDSCHSAKIIGHSDRRDPQLCVTCHTDQTKYGFAEAPTTPTGYDDTSSIGYKRVNGEAAFTFPRMIHQTHMGEHLVKTGYNLNAHARTFNADGTPRLLSDGKTQAYGCEGPTSTNGMHQSSNAGQCLNQVGFPQSPANCTTCHDGSSNKSDGSVNANKTANGDNWKNKPSIIACGSCHDGIDFATGLGTTIAGATTGHVGGAQLNSANCIVCHGPGTTIGADVEIVHRLTVPTLNNPVVKAGVSSITYDLKSVTINSSNQPVVTFRINRKDGTTPFAPVMTLATPAPAIAGLTRGPTFYVAYAVAQDGITNPADFNGRVSASLDSLLAGTAGSISGPDTSGYFTATLTGPSTALITIPTGAKMVTGMMVGRFDQVVGGVTVRLKPMLRTVVASGYTGRRVIVATARCNTCHDQLGTSPEFHGGERNDPTACAICHTPNQINDGKQTENYGWAGASSTYIHGIHAASKRTVPFMWAAWDFPEGLSGVQYPKSALTDCGQCHEPNTVNFGANGTTVAPNLLFTTTSAGSGTARDVALVGNVSPYIDSSPTADYGLPASVSSAGLVTPAAATTLVNSPIASACFSCHDTSTAKNHMESNGGVIYGVRGTNPVNAEGCLACHGVGKQFDAAVMHK